MAANLVLVGGREARQRWDVLFQLRTREVVARRWANVLNKYEVALLFKLIDVTVSYGREHYTSSLEALISGKDDEGVQRYGRVDMSVKTARRALDGLRRTGLISTTRRQVAQTFKVDYELLMAPWPNFTTPPQPSTYGAGSCLGG